MEGRLLLVDDDPGVLDLLYEYFAGQGYEVEVASSGEVALSAVRAKRPDLVILDIRMPGMDGVEVLRRLRRQDATLPVIMVTANEDVTRARPRWSASATARPPPEGGPRGAVPQDPAHRLRDGQPHARRRSDFENRARGAHPRHRPRDRQPAPARSRRRY